MAGSLPAYGELFASGQLRQRAAQALAQLADCTLCGRMCHAHRLTHAASETQTARPKYNRQDGCSQPNEPTLPPADQPTPELHPAKKDLGFCRTGRWAVVSSFFPHHGEEPCLRGWGGSGTIFFTHCNLRCVFCQNWDISWQGEGRTVQPNQLAQMMLALQAEGCHNINLVTPSHVVPQILEALVLAVEQGLRLPLVYNTGGYDRVETLRLLDGVIDIYMPDIKFLDPELARRWAAAPDYPDVVRSALREMHRQVGDLQIDEQGIARRGLLVRYLVMPGCLTDAEQVMRFLAEEISPHTFVNVMPQYHPEGRAWQYPELARRITSEEYHQALAAARRYGLRLCRE